MAKMTAPVGGTSVVTQNLFLIRIIYVCIMAWKLLPFGCNTYLHNDIQGAQMRSMSQLNQIAAIATSLGQVIDKQTGLPIKDLDILIQNAKVEGWRYNFATLVPLAATTDQEALVEPAP